MMDTSTTSGSEDVQKWCQVATDLTSMRRGSVSMEEQLSEVVPREFLVCPLCQEEYQEPKYLPCLHSFCKACIDEHIEATSDQEGCFACPVCATETVKPEAEDEGPELPDNAFARRLSCPTIVQGKRDKTCGQCESAGLKEEATIHCINCDEFLCGTCSLNHLDQEETASHKTQKIEDYEEEEMPLASSPQSAALPRCCEYYDALDIGSMFCVDCEMSVCAECHNNTHHDHRCAELSAISQNFENKIKDPLKELKKDKHTLHKALFSLENARKYTAKKQQDLKLSVKKRTKMLGTLIQEYESMLIMELEKKHAQNLAVIQEREDAIQRHISSIKAVTDLTEKLLTFGSDDEKVSMRRKIGRRVRELCEEELPTNHIELTKCVLSEPKVTVETICEMFGELRSDTTKQATKKKRLTGSQSVDLGLISRKTGRPRHSLSSTDEVPTELAELEEYDEAEDMDMLSNSNASDIFRPASSLLSGSGNSNDDLKLSGMSGLSPRHLEVPETSHTDSSFQSSVGGADVPCHNLEDVKREMHFPEVVAQDCIKGVGVNSQGDIIVGTVSPGGSSKVFILEKHGIVRGQIAVEKNWGIHSIAADGKVSLVVPRGENRYKVKVMSGENNCEVLFDTHIESFGLNSVTATKTGVLLVTANRYATTNTILGRSAKSGGNITMYDLEGMVIRVITNETYADIHTYLFDRPHHIAIDNQGNFFVADPGRHSVIGFKADGDFMFEYGNTDAEEELYQGPDIICTDRLGNVIVLDKKDGRIDILNYEGHLQRCYFPSEHVRFVCVTPDKNLLLVTSEGEMKFYDYL